MRKSIIKFKFKNELNVCLPNYPPQSAYQPASPRLDRKKMAATLPGILWSPQKTSLIDACQVCGPLSRAPDETM